MSKLPPSSLWPRGASAAARSALHARSSTSGASAAAYGLSRVVGKRRHASFSSSQQAGLALQPVGVVKEGGAGAVQQQSVAELPGAVVAPFCGPQPRAVAEQEAALQLVVQHRPCASLSEAASTSTPSAASSAVACATAQSASSSSSTGAAFARAPLLAPQPMRRYFSASYAPSAPGGISSTSSALPGTPPSSASASSPSRLARTHVDGASALLDPSARAASRLVNVEAPHLQRLIAEMMGGTASVEPGARRRGATRTPRPSEASARAPPIGAPELAALLGSETASQSSGSGSGAEAASTPPSSPSPGPGGAGESSGSQSYTRAEGGFTMVAPRSEALATLPAQRSTGTSDTTTAPNAALALLHLGARQSSSSADGAHERAAPSLEAEWQGAFNAPRSARHNFTLEHGAYGIPKRHPLSAVRAAAGRREKMRRDKDAGVSAAPQLPPAPKSRLAQAADFLTGASSPPPPPPRGGNSTASTEPVDAEEARKAALHQGSTPGGEEALDPNVAAGKYAARAIRDAKGAIVRERLRSVQVGEDAYFLRPDSLGVADGVGGWASRPGADPALFSRLLMHFCAVELSRYDKLSASELSANGGALLAAWSSVDPVEVMHHAWERCVRASRREGILGSSTALLALLRGDELRIANVGDCVLLIIREGDLLFRSEEQQHSFNFPVQLGMMGETAESIDKRRREGHAGAAAKEGSVGDEHADEDYDDPHPDGPTVAQSAAAPGAADATQAGATQEAQASAADDDEPEWDEPRRDAGRYTVTVQRGDIIIVGSDGLMDNLFDEDILEEVLRFAPWPSAEAANAHTNNDATSKNVNPLPEDFSPQLVSEALCSRAKAVSEDSRAISSPFQQRAVEEGLHYVGGKHDDISVLVAVIKGDDDGLVSGLSSATASHSTAASTAPHQQHSQQAAAQQPHL